VGLANIVCPDGSGEPVGVCVCEGRDFVNVVEAPDELTMARLSLELGARGSVKFQTLPLLRVDDFLGALEG